MPRKDYLDRKPLIHPSAFVAKSADLIGAVTVEEEASIWYGAVLRAVSYTHLTLPTKA